MIYQIHPEHGYHIAYSFQEAKANEENGWQTVTKDKFYDRRKIGVPVEEYKNDEIDAIKESTRETLEHLYAEKFGEKPHHRMKDETIKEKLEE